MTQTAVLLRLLHISVSQACVSGIGYELNRCGVWNLVAANVLVKASCPKLAVTQPQNENVVNKIGTGCE
jgi:hypothetical protein